MKQSRLRPHETLHRPNVQRKHAPVSRQNFREQASRGLLYLVVLGCPLARGGTDWRVELVTGTLAIAAVLVLPSAGRRISWVLAGLGAVLGFMLFQFVPLPPALIAFLSPQTDGVLKDSLSALGAYPAFRPLSLDPPASAHGVAQAAVCLAVFSVAFEVAQERAWRRQLLGSIVLAGVLASVAHVTTSFLAGGAGFDSKFPFVNPNNLGGLLGMCAWPALALGLHARGAHRVKWLAAFLAITAGVFFSASRGAMGAYGFGAALFLYLRWRHTPDRSAPWRAPWKALAPMVILVAIATGTALGGERVFRELASIGVPPPVWPEKHSIWPTLAQMIAAFPATGIGRGSFYAVFSMFRRETDGFTWTHAENEWLQAPIDLGVPAGLVLVGTFFLSWGLAFRRKRLSLTEMGVLAGVATLAVHNIVDFSFSVPGVAVPFAACAALLARHQRSWALPRGLASAMLFLFAALTGAGFVTHRLFSAEREGRELEAETVLSRVVARAAEVAKRHPADYLPHLIAGARLVESRACAQAMPWLERAMLLNPTGPAAHRYAARCLAEGHQDALALREYRLAFLFGDASSVREAFRRFPDVPDVFQLAPDTPSGLVDLGIALATAGRFEDARRVLERCWNTFREIRALEQLCDTELRAGRTEESLKCSRLLETEEPRSVIGYQTAALALSRLSGPPSAIDELARGARAVPGHPDLLLAHAQLLLDLGRAEEALRILDTAVPSSARDGARLHRSRSSCLLAQGNLMEAIQEARAALSLDPSAWDTRLALASLYVKVGRTGDAAQQLDLAGATPGVPREVVESRRSELGIPAAPSPSGP